MGQILVGAFWLVLFIICAALAGLFISKVVNSKAGCLLTILLSGIALYFTVLTPSVFTIWAFQGNEDVNPSGQFIEPDSYKIGNTQSPGNLFGLDNDYYLIIVSKDLDTQSVHTEAEWYSGDSYGFTDGRSRNTKNFIHEDGRCYQFTASPEYETDFRLAVENQFYNDPDRHGYLCARSYTYNVPYKLWNGNPNYIEIIHVDNDGNEEQVFLYQNNEVKVNK